MKQKTRVGVPILIIAIIVVAALLYIGYVSQRSTRTLPVAATTIPASPGSGSAARPTKALSPQGYPVPGQPGSAQAQASGGSGSTSAPGHYPVPGYPGSAQAQASGGSASMSAPELQSRLPAGENGSRGKMEMAHSLPLPSSTNGSVPFIDKLVPVLQKPLIGTLFVPKDLIRRIVVTVDDLGRTGPIPLRIRAVPAVPGWLIVEHRNGAMFLSPANAVRYTSRVRQFHDLNTMAVTQLYFHYYPLFQQAYEQLGFPHGYFNDRLVQVIDEMLAAPEISGPIELLQPHVLYTFADPELQALSAGQKLMICIGLRNEAIVKSKLRELRVAVTSGKAR